MSKIPKGWTLWSPGQAGGRGFKRQHYAVGPDGSVVGGYPSMTQAREAAWAVHVGRAAPAPKGTGQPGRPSSAVIYDARITVRVSRETREAVERGAEARGQTVTEFARAALEAAVAGKRGRS